MITGLSILLRKDHLPDRIAHGVVARIHGVAAGAADESGYYKEVIIPAGRDEGLQVAVLPGRYRVQAILPSGEILQQEKSVGEGSTVHFIFSAPAPREWLSWQAFDGAVVAPAALEARAKPEHPNLDPVRRLGSSLVNKAIREFMSLVLGSRSGNAGVGIPLPDVFPDVWRGDRKEVSVAIAAQPAGGLDAIWSAAAVARTHEQFVGRWPAEVRQGFEVQLMRQEGAVGLWRVNAPLEEPLFLPEGRCWALVETDGLAEVASLPLPWLDVNANPSPLDILVNTAAEDPTRRTSLMVNDATLGGLLAYLGRGRLATSGALLDSLSDDQSITRMMLGSHENPLAACAAAYVGLAIHDTDQPRPWDRTLANVMSLFPSIPDGSIIFARRALQRQSSEAQRAEILTALKQAYKAGIPYFTAGVLHLRDGLVLFANRDKEAREMLEMVSRVASRLDPKQAFTVLRFMRG